MIERTATKDSCERLPAAADVGSPRFDFELGLFGLDDAAFLPSSLETSFFEPTSQQQGDSTSSEESRWKRPLPSYTAAPVGLCELSHLDKEDLSYLARKECFVLPPTRIQDRLVETYFLYVHPFLPFLAEDRLWSDYVHSLRHTSFLVYRAILFAASSVSRTL